MEITWLHSYIMLNLNRTCVLWQKSARITSADSVLLYNMIAIFIV